MKINKIQTFIGIKKPEGSFQAHFGGQKPKETEGDSFEVISVNSQKWDKKRLEEIYNKTYDIVIAQNPITKELNLKKPCFEYGESEEGSIASYSFVTNTISVSNFFENDCYLYTIFGTNGEPCDYIIEADEKGNLTEFEKQFDKFTKEKLNEGEKELYASALFAHEIRHCIQEHICASTKGVMGTHRANCKKTAKELREQCLVILALIDTLKDFKQNNREEIEDLDAKKVERLIKKEGGTAKKMLERIKYSLEYKPKKILPKNTKLKFSLFDEDKRYWSIKDHFLETEEDIKKRKLKGENTGYFASPLEIDAYNYEIEFICTNFSSAKEDLREDILHKMVLSLYVSSNLLGLENMEEFGHKPLIEE